MRQGSDDQQDNLAAPDVLGRQRLFRGPVFEVWRDSVRMPQGTNTERDVVRHPGAVAIVAVTAAQELALLRQYRYAVDRVLWELPAGTREPDESAAASARRELREETGLAASRLHRICGFYTTPGFTDEWMELFFAPDVVAHPEGPAPEQGEQLRLEMVPYRRALEMARDGSIVDAKTLLGIWLLSAFGMVEHRSRDETSRGT